MYRAQCCSSPLVGHVVDSVALAEHGESALTPEILALGGMSSAKVRHFLNNVCSRVNTRYLEVGTYAGSTLVSALFRNWFSTSSAHAIDDYSQFGGWEAFQTVTEQHLIPGQFTFWRDDFRNVKPEYIAPINVYFYDGAHEAKDQYDAITHFWPCLANEFVLIVDDWLEPQVKQGTFAALDYLNGQYEMLLKMEMPSRGNGDTEQWWNGLFVAVIRKKTSQPGEGD